MPPNPPPRSFMIFPDPVLRAAGDGVLLDTSFTAAAPPDGAYPDVAVPDSDNRGGLQIYQGGTPSSRQNLDYRVIASGDIWNGATWAWKRSSDVTPTDNLSVVWRGANDNRYFWACHDPYQNDVSNTSPTIALVYSSVLRRELIYRAQSDGTIKVAYRTVDGHTYAAAADSAAAWLFETCTKPNGEDLTINDALVGDVLPLDVVELEDGRLAMALISDSGRDFSILYSDDGFVWRYAADDILARFGTWGAARYGFFGFHFRRSGPYLRVVFGHHDFDDEIPPTLSTGKYIRTLVSSDRGTTWEEVSDTEAALTALTITDETGGDASSTPMFCLIPFNDAAGTFMLVHRNGTDAIVNAASGTNGWTLRDDLEIAEGGSAGLYQLAGCRGPEWIYLLDLAAIGGVASVMGYLYMIDPRDPFSLSSWKLQHAQFKDQGALRFRLRNIKIVNVGNNYLALTAALYDPQDGYAVEEYGMVYMRFGGWDPLPVEERDHPRMGLAPPYRHQPGSSRDPVLGDDADYQLCRIVWDAWMGSPSPVAGVNVASATPWTRPAHSGTTAGWNTSRVQYTDAVGVASQWVNRYDDTASIWFAGSWFVNTTTTTAGDERSSSMLEWVIRIDQDGLALITADDIALRLKSYDIHGGTTKAADISIRHTSTNVRIYDNTTGTDVIATTAVTGIATKYLKFRLGLLSQPYKTGNPVECALWYRSEEDESAAWTLVGTGTISTAGTHTDQYLEWGHLTSQTSAALINRRITRWRRVALYGPHDGGATRAITNAWGDPDGGATNDDATTDNLRGRGATWDPVLIEKGITATVQGGAAAEGDTYAGSINYSFHPRNLTMIGSPQVGYRSAIPASGTTAVFLDYDAGYSDTGRSFQHSAAAIAGYAAPSISLIYSASPAGVGASDTYTFDLTLYGPARVRSATLRNGIVIADADPEIPPLGEVASVENGPTYYMRVTAGTCAASIGKTWIVERDNDWSGTDRLFTIQPGDDDIESYQLSGASVTFYADRAILLYSTPVNRRYLRISMPNTTTAYANQHRLGTFLAGTTMVFNPPLDWSHTDSEHGNVTQHTTKSGVRWGYSEGPPQRTLEAQIVGDVDSVRRRMRSYLRALSGFDTFPVAICLDDLDPLHPAKGMIGCVDSGSEFVQDAWKWDDVQQRWIATGNQKIKIKEEI